MVEQDLARSLRLIAEQGPDVLHTGALASRIVDELRRQGSYVTSEDLAQSRPEWGEASFDRLSGVPDCHRTTAGKLVCRTGQAWFDVAVEPGEPAIGFDRDIGIVWRK